MKINVNGHARDMTAEEIADIRACTADTPPEMTEAERIASMEQQIALLLGGDTE